MFSGAYFIGRKATSSGAKVVTDTALQLVNEGTTNLPYTNFNKK